MIEILALVISTVLYAVLITTCVIISFSMLVVAGYAWYRVFKWINKWG